MFQEYCWGWVYKLLFKRKLSPVDLRLTFSDDSPSTYVQIEYLSDPQRSWLSSLFHYPTRVRDRRISGKKEQNKAMSMHLERVIFGIGYLGTPCTHLQGNLLPSFGPFEVPCSLLFAKLTPWGKSVPSLGNLPNGTRFQPIRSCDGRNEAPFLSRTCRIDYHHQTSVIHWMGRGADPALYR